MMKPHSAPLWGRQPHTDADSPDEANADARQLSLRELLAPAPVAATAQWDASCPREQHPKEYSALHDKFLKFHRPARSTAAKQRLALQHAMYRRLQEESLGIGGGTSAAVASSSLGSGGGAGGGGALASVADVQREIVRNRQLCAGSDEPPPDPEAVAAKAQERLHRLWDELAVPRDHRAHIVAVAFASPATPESVALLHEEVSRVVALRSATRELHAAVDDREQVLYALQELAQRAADTPHPVREARPLFARIRTASFAVVDKVREWRRLLGYDAVYLWRGVAYLCKMATDLHFLAAIPALQRAAGCRIAGNPLLDPAKTVILEGTASQQQRRGGGGAPNALPTRARMLPPLMHKMPSAGAGVSLAFPPEVFEEAEALIGGEFHRYATHLESHGVHRFDALDGSEPDPELVRSADACRFVPEDVDELLYQNHNGNEMSEAARLEMLGVIRIQKLFRGAIDRRRAREVRRRHAAALTLQRLYRCWAARRERWRRHRRHHAASRIQAVARGVQVREGNARMRCLHTHASRIQALFKGNAARRRVGALRALHHCATAIQRVFRGFASRRRTAVFKDATLAHAAATIQKVWRAGQLRQSGCASPSRQRAALRIQTWFRRVAAIRFVSRLREVNRAAARVEAVVRGGYARRTDAAAVVPR